MLHSIVAEVGESPTPTEPQPAVTANDQAVRPLPQPHPLLRFRKAVIAVLAVIHLRALSKESTLLFTASSAHHRLLPVSIGGRPGRTAKTSARGPHPLPTSHDLGAWLRSRRVMRAVREGMREIQRAMEMSQSTISGSSHEHTQHPATLTDLPVQKGYASLVEELNTLFTGHSSSLALPPATTSSSSSSNYSATLCYNSDSLAYRLARGLTALTSRRETQFSSYLTPQEVHVCTH